MAATEFDLIERFFSRLSAPRQDIPLGIGDDCALLQVPSDRQLAVSIDTLVEGVHFFPGTDPEALGHKALAVSLSDLAAMGATPAWVTLALTLPSIDLNWLASFCRGFSALAEKYQVALVGGDTTSGPLSVTVQAHGFVTPGQALRRDGAQPGESIYVTGQLGDACLALRVLKGDQVAGPSQTQLQRRLERPEPRLAVGQALAGIATAAIDISDGLKADLGHICQRSGVGAVIELASLPCTAAVREYIHSTADWTVALAGGDDYELCFTLAPGQARQVATLAANFGLDITRIGRIEAGSAVVCVDQNGLEIPMDNGGFDHFSN